MSTHPDINDDEGGNNRSHQAIGSSPNSHMIMTGPEFSAQDLHELLGGVLGDAHPGSSYLQSLCESDVGDDKAVARTERKRSREKQRRCDVNRQFTELTTAVRTIEADCEELRAPTLYSPNNRADLIARTVALLNQLHESNKKRKHEITKLQDELQNAKKAGEEAAAKLKESMMAPQNLGGNRVVMMVPMMIGGDGGATPANMAQFGQGMPFMAPVPVSDPAVAAAPFAQAPTQQADSVAPGAVPTPWGMMPPWLMQNMLMMGGMPTSSNPSMSASTGSNNNSRDQKVAGVDSSVTPVGSNLAHCA